MSVGVADTRWMKGSRVKGAVLGMLVELDQPIHPYRLATLINRRLGPAAEIDRESIYKLLQVLAKRELVDCVERETADGDWRRRRVYSANEATRRALSEWMETRTPGYDSRTELQVKIAFSRASDAPALLRELDAYEADCMQRLATCKAAAVEMLISSWAGLEMNLSRKASELHLEAELSWIMIVRDLINEYLAESDAALR